MLVVLDNNRPNGLKTVYDATINFNQTEEHVQVLFRLDGENNEFNPTC